MFSPTREITSCNIKPSWKVERRFTVTVRANIFGNSFPSAASFKGENCHSEVVQDSSLVATSGSGCRNIHYVLSWSMTFFRHRELQGPASYCYVFIGSRKNLKALGCCKRNVTQESHHTQTSSSGRDVFQVCKFLLFWGIHFICAENEWRWGINLT